MYEKSKYLLLNTMRSLLYEMDGVTLVALIIKGSLLWNNFYITKYAFLDRLFYPNIRSLHLKTISTDKYEYQVVNHLDTLFYSIPRSLDNSEEPV